MSVSFLDEKGEAPQADYFGSYTKLAKVLPLLSSHIEGRPMKVNVICKKLADAQELRNLYSAKETLDITVLVSEALFDKLSLMYPEEVKRMSKYGLLEKLIQDRKMRFARGCISVLYNAVDNKSKDGFIAALDTLQGAYNILHEITRADIAEFFYVQDVIFPRQVLTAFLLMKRNRWKLYKMCEKSYPASLIYYAMRDNLDKIITTKGKYYETGQRDYLSALIPANNIARMKLMFTHKIKDPYVLLKLYEGGIDLNDSCE